jgi:acetyltransferase-like isoleucine patch superfamily enzyme
MSNFLNRIREINKEETLAGLSLKLWRRFKIGLISCFYKYCFAEVGEKTLFEGALRIRGGKNIKIGKNVYIEKDVILVAAGSGSIEIEDNCMVWNNVEIRAAGGPIKIGKNTTLNKSVTLKNGVADPALPAKIILGDSVWIGQNSILEGQDIELEDRVILAPFVHIVGNDHIRDPEEKTISLSAAAKSAPIRLKRNCWIGSGAKVLKSVCVGECAIVGSGSVVTRDVADLETVAGVPARALNKANT